MQRVQAWTVLLALAAVLVFATGAQDQGLKIGMVDIEQALNATTEGKSTLEELKRKQRDAEAQIQPLFDQYNSLKEEVKGKKYVLSQDALFDKQAQLAELENKIKTKRDELEGQLKIDQARALAPLQQKMKDTIEAIGKEQGFTMIIRRDNPFVVYSREALDITDLVVSRFNKKS